MVTDKEDVLGQISIPLSELAYKKPMRQIRAPLQPHKKCSNPEGELAYQAWISQSQPSATSTPHLATSPMEKDEKTPSSLQKLRSKIGRSPKLGRKSYKSGGSDNVSGAELSLGPKNAQSCLELGPGQNSSYSNLLSTHSKSMHGINSSGTGQKPYLSGSFSDLTEDGNKPEVSGISPREGPVEGGTRLTIRGNNLGEDKGDIVGLQVCGCNCLASLEYESARKIYCTTKGWRPCTGNIVIETESGGKGCSLVKFNFLPSKEATQEKQMKTASPSHTPMAPPRDSKKKSAPSVPPANASNTPAIFVRDEQNRGSQISQASSTFYDDQSDSSAVYGSPQNVGESSFFVKEMESRKSVMSKSTEEFMPPEITGVSPREGPIEGGTKITLRGKNFGVNKDDITSITICGADCTSTIEFISPRKLFCVSKMWRACVGDIVIETQSGGKGTSLVQFTYKASGGQTSKNLDDFRHDSMAVAANDDFRSDTSAGDDHSLDQRSISPVGSLQSDRQSIHSDRQSLHSAGDRQSWHSELPSFHESNRSISDKDSGTGTDISGPSYDPSNTYSTYPRTGHESPQPVIEEKPSTLPRPNSKSVVEASDAKKQQTERWSGTGSSGSREQNIPVTEDDIQDLQEWEKAPRDKPRLSVVSETLFGMMLALLCSCPI